MKAYRLELKALEVEGQPMLYKDMLKVVLSSGGTAGMSTDEVIKSDDIKAELRSAETTLLLSEQDYKVLVSKLNGMKWTTSSEQLAGFIRDIRSAPLIDLEAP